MALAASRILAIDPGVDGAIAYVHRDSTGKITEAELADITTYHHPSGRYVDVKRILGETFVGGAWPHLAVIETPLGFHDTRNEVVHRGITGRIGNAPLKMSAKTRDLTMINYGRLQCLVESRCMNATWEAVLPSVWKAKVGVTKDKGGSLALARVIYPMLADDLKRQKDHNRAEALLIAEYAYHHVWLPKQLN